MKVKASLRSLKNRPGSQVVRRRGKVYVIGRLIRQGGGPHLLNGGLLLPGTHVVHEQHVRPAQHYLFGRQLGETAGQIGKLLLEALTAAGADMMYDCRKGECGLCLVDIDSSDGELDHQDLFLSDRQKDSGASMCICVSRVARRAGTGERPVPTLVLP